MSSQVQTQIQVTRQQQTTVAKAPPAAAIDRAERRVNKAAKDACNKSNHAVVLGGKLDTARGDTEHTMARAVAKLVAICVMLSCECCKRALHSQPPP